MNTASNPKEKLTFIIEGPKSVWKLLGIHPRFGPTWTRVTEDDEEGAHEIAGFLGDIFKIYSSEFDYAFVTIAENESLKEINDIVFEDFAYSISRRWYNILRNTGTFKGNLDDDE